MATVELDYGRVENNCIVPIDNVIDYLNEAINYLQQFSIPSDFSKRTALYNIIADLKNQRALLSDVKKSIVNSNKNYDSMIDKLDQQASQLPVYHVRTRSTII